MAYKPKYHSERIQKSQNPSTTSIPSRSCSESPDEESEVVETSHSSLEVVRKTPSQYYIPEYHEVHSLIQKLEQISISDEKPERLELSEESITSLLQ